MARQFAVIGLGRFGSSIARTLYNQGCEVLAIDRREEMVQEMSGSVTQAVQLDATDEKALKAVGIENIDVAIVAIGENLQASILISILLKEVGVKEVIAKARTPLHGRILKKIGADKIIFPEKEMGARLARSLVTTNILEQVELSPGYSVVEILAPKEFAGKSIGEMKLRRKHGINVLAIKRTGKDPESGKETDFSPRATDIIKEEDMLVILGSNEDIDKMTGKMKK